MEGDGQTIMMTAKAKHNLTKAAAMQLQKEKEKALAEETEETSYFNDLAEETEEQQTEETNLINATKIKTTVHNTTEEILGQRNSRGSREKTSQVSSQSFDREIMLIA